jgi:hypothetical protein
MDMAPTPFEAESDVIDWETIKRWLRIGKELGFRLVREDCRHCNGRGLCTSGRGESYSISCATCQIAALGKKAAEIVKCEVCGGRGVHVYTMPAGDQLSKVTLEVMPQEHGEWSSLRVRVMTDPQVAAVPKPLAIEDKRAA